MSFPTRYNPLKRVPRILSSEDNVDRLSYVDNTLMVKRLIMEGKNLAIYRANALSRGLYGHDEAMQDNSGDIVVPVYPTDPVFTAPMLSDALAKSKSARKDVKDAQADLDFTKDKDVSTGSIATGSAVVQEAEN